MDETGYYDPNYEYNCHFASFTSPEDDDDAEAYFDYDHENEGVPLGFPEDKFVDAEEILSNAAPAGVEEDIPSPEGKHMRTRSGRVIKANDEDEQKNTKEDHGEEPMDCEETPAAQAGGNRTVDSSLNDSGVGSAQKCSPKQGKPTQDKQFKVPPNLCTALSSFISRDNALSGQQKPVRKSPRLRPTARKMKKPYIPLVPGSPRASPLPKRQRTRSNVDKQMNSSLDGVGKLAAHKGRAHLRNNSVDSPHTIRARTRTRSGMKSLESSVYSTPSEPRTRQNQHSRSNEKPQAKTKKDPE